MSEADPDKAEWARAIGESSREDVGEAPAEKRSSSLGLLPDQPEGCLLGLAFVAICMVVVGLWKAVAWGWKAAFQGGASGKATILGRDAIDTPAQRPADPADEDSDVFA